MHDAEQGIAPRARILVAATGKGGAGKSTTIACLATYWHRAGHRVALLDADPNQTLTRWHAKGSALAAMTLRTEPAEDRIIPIVGDLADRHDLVLIDCPGFGSQANVFAVGAADLVLIPVMTDEANVFEALRMRRLVESASRLTRRSIPARTLLTRVKRSGVADHSHRQLVALDAEPLTARIADRAIFQEASFHGSSPVMLDPSGPAAREIEALAVELETLDWWRTAQDGVRTATPISHKA
jgi:chromosome partitioning protein